MIRYSLRCDDGHLFDSWFQSAAAYDHLRAGGHLSCPDCGDGRIDKAIMAPRVATAGEGPPRPDAPGPLAELRRRIEAHSTYVGRDFVTQARAMHDGDAPARLIHGEARIDQARALLEDGVPIAPLPFVPKARTN